MDSFQLEMGQEKTWKKIERRTFFGTSLLG